MMSPELMQEWSKTEQRTVIAGFRGRFIHSANITFALWDIDAGAQLPVHSHEHEQVMHVLEGEFEVTIAGKVYLAKGGSVVVIPSHAIHSGKAITSCRIMDAFYPLREDYMRFGGQNILQQASGA